MKKERWTTSKTAVFNIGYHLIWCPKYRRKVLTGDIEKRFKELLYEKANTLGCEIEIMEVMPDRCHIFIKATPNHAPQYIVGQLKGYTSRTLRQEFPSLKSRIPSLWTRSYYCESVGNISKDTVTKYIKNQKNK